MPSPNGSPITIVIPRDKGSKPPKSSGFWSSISRFWSSIKRYWGQYLFFFLGGVGVGLHVSVAKLGVIVALGAASHGAFFGLVAALVVGLIVTGFLFALTRYLLERFVTYLAINTIESNIKSALRDNDPEKTNLKFWLAKAHNPKGVFNENCWKYKFSDGRSLVTYALDASERRYAIYQKPTWYQKRSRNKYLHTSQSYLKGIFLTEHVYSKSLNSVNSPEPVKSELNPASRPRSEPPKLKWYQNLLLWFKEVLNISWQFNNEDFYEGSQERFPALARTPVNSSLVPDLQNNTQNQQPLPSPTPLDTKDTKHNSNTKEGDKKEDKKTEKQPEAISAPTATNAKSPSIPNRPTTTVRNQADKTKRNIINETSIRERYTPEQILHTRAIIQDMMTPDNAAKANAIAGLQSLEAKPEKLTPSNTAAIPPHLQHWVKRISLQHQLERSHQRQVVQATERKMDIKIDLARNLSQSISVEHDQSKLLPASRVVQKLRDRQYWGTCSWFQSLINSLAVYAPDLPNRYLELDKILFITEECLEILMQGHGYVRENDSVSLKMLPLGFDIDAKRDEKGKITQIVLSYNEEIREAQLADPEKYCVNLRFDPASRNLPQQKINYSRDEKFIVKATLLRTLTAKAISLNDRQTQFLNKLDEDKGTVRFFRSGLTENDQSKVGETLHGLKGCVFNALQLIANAAPPNHFLEFVNILNDFYERPVNSQNCHNLLHLFTQHYLMGLENGSEFNTRDQIAALQKLVRLPEQHLQWFVTLSEACYQMGGMPFHAYFEETSKGLYFILDFFLRKNLPLPDPDVISSGANGGFTQLAGIINCITLAGQHGREMLELQTRFIKHIPRRSLELSEAQLRSGYSFVHEAMCFDYYYFTNICLQAFIPQGLICTLREKLGKKLFINREEFSSLNYSEKEFSSFNHWEHETIQGANAYACFYRALFLRYVALHVDPAYVQQALNLWTTTTADSFEYPVREKLDALHQLLKEKWGELKARVLQLPTKLAAANENKPFDIFTHFQEQDPNKPAYQEKDIANLFNQLHLDERLSRRLKDQILAINELSIQYSQMTADKLAEALKNAKTTNVENRLAMLREAHYRFTCARSNSNSKQEEWLRLEQLLAILIAMDQSSLIQLETSEGKTIVIQMIALLKALQGEKVDVLTHNAVLANLAANKLAHLASLLGLKIAKQNSSEQEIVDADIFYSDISDAVINEKLAQIPKDFRQVTQQSKQEDKKEEKHPLAGNRLASTALVDEADNVLIDILANTTMQVSDQNSKADEGLEEFLNLLNRAVREELSEVKHQKSDCDSQLEIVQREVANNAYYKKYRGKLAYWISAAVTAMQQQENVDYVIETEDVPVRLERLEKVPILNEVVHIIHKDTTGRVDKISQWSDGVHQCVAAWEKHKNRHTRMKIPGMSEVIAEGDVVSYLRRECYTTRCGFTGTLGEEAIRTQMEKTLSTNITVFMPRAKRFPPGGAAWPLEPEPENNRRGDRQSPVFNDIKAMESVDDEKEQKELYTRAYRFFRPMLVQNKTAHFAKLLEAVQKIQAANQSGIIFFNTIVECNEFSKYLRDTNIEQRNIQILDDTQDKESAANEQKFRPPEAVVIERAKNPQMITLTTAAGSRGTDFDNITVGILAKPGLNRVTAQKAGRIGRNGQFGMMYKIYCVEDLHPDVLKKFFPESANKAEEKVKLSQALPNSASATQRQALSVLPSAKDAKGEHEEKMRDDADLQSPIDLHEQKSQEVDLKSIRDKEAQRAYNQAWQARFFQLPSAARRELDTKWPQFFEENKSKPVDEKAWEAFIKPTAG